MKNFALLLAFVLSVPAIAQVNTTANVKDGATAPTVTEKTTTRMVPLNNDTTTMKIGADGVAVNMVKPPSSYKVVQTTTQTSIGTSAPAKRITECTEAMDKKKFEEAKAILGKLEFDDSKIEVSKEIAASHCLSTQQITDLIKTFAFDSSRVAFAKYAYDYCVDPKQYPTLLDHLTFDESKVEFNKFILKKN